MILIKKVEGLRDSAELVAPIVFDGRTYFSTAELGCRCSVCQGRGKLADGFREMLLAFRLRWNRPMSVSSCCRCLQHNSAEGGTAGSYHIYETEVGACAIDTRITDSVWRAKFVELAQQFGFRVGVNGRFIHMDWAPEYYPAEKRKMFLY